MLDKQFATMVSNYVSSKYGVSPPTVTVSNNIGYPGTYYKENINLRPTSSVEVLLHEVGHHVFKEKGIQFANRDLEDRKAQEFAWQEAENLGIKLEPYKTYMMKLKTTNPNKLFNSIIRNQTQLGLEVRTFNIGKDSLDMLVGARFPIMPSPGMRQEGDERYIAPIIWAIGGLAASVGVVLIAYEVTSASSESIKTAAGVIVAIAIIGICLYVYDKHR
jgi:hypothetical protein